MSNLQNNGRRSRMLTALGLLLAGGLLIAVLLLAPGRLVGLFHTRIAATPAPTSIALPTVAAAPAATPAKPTPTRSASPVPAATESPAADMTPAASPSPAAAVPAAPTRVVAPAEPIALPAGFGISLFVAGLSDPRMLALGPDGQLYVAERGAGRILRLPDRDGDGVCDGVEVAAQGLDAPSSIAFFRDGSLYIGETARILRLRETDQPGFFDGVEVVVAGLPRGGHTTRTVLFSADWSALYVSVGSSCNACAEDDPRRAAILRYTPDGAGEALFATGLRNAVGMALRPGSDELWVTNNGRDWLGEDQPPETVYRLRQGDDAGWPRCHSGRIIDPEFGAADACEGVLAPAVEMQAHSAPLGLAFYSGAQFPAEYRGDLFVAFHGSWNRSRPTGYKLVRIPFDGEQPGAVEDFATGWLRADGSQWGRPVDVLTGPDGSLFVSDDAGGRLYRIFYAGQ